MKCYSIAAPINRHGVSYIKRLSKCLSNVAESQCMARQRRKIIHLEASGSKGDIFNVKEISSGDVVALMSAASLIKLEEGTITHNRIISHDERVAPSIGRRNGIDEVLGQNMAISSMGNRPTIFIFHRDIHGLLLCWAPARNRRHNSQSGIFTIGRGYAMRNVFAARSI